MKNREKFRDAIVKNAKTTEKRVNVCEFIKINVLPHFGAKDCYSINCAWCKFLTELWLDEEYTEPPKPEVDWDKVPVDTLVMVRNSVMEDWKLRYFREFRKDYHYNRYITWSDGKTSKTAEGACLGWQYCELAEDEDGSK